MTIQIVAAFPSRLSRYSYPKTIRVDQGSDFVLRDLDLGAYARGVVRTLKLRNSHWSTLSVTTYVCADAIRGLSNRGLGGRKLGKCIEQAEIVDGAIVACRYRGHSGILQAVRVGLALITQDIVLVGDHKSRRKPLELGQAGP